MGEKYWSISFPLLFVLTSIIIFAHFLLQYIIFI